MGGGWCYTEADCYQRASNPTGWLGSTNFYTAGLIPEALNGFFSTDCTVNPEFCNYNIVRLIYCDGNSWAGDRPEPVDFTVGSVTTPLYFRGFRILQAALHMLLSEHQMNQATHIMLNGCSAGGLAALLHADYVKEFVESAIPGLDVYKVLACSALFPTSIPNIAGDFVMAEQQQSMFEVHGASAGVNQDCIADKSASESWKCNTAEGVLPYIRSPLFMVQSMYDAFGTQCIYAAKAVADTSLSNGDCSAFPEWQACIGPNYNFNEGIDSSFAYFDPNNCTQSQVSTLNNNWYDQMYALTQSISTFSKNGNGAFLHSCHVHCGSMLDGSFALWPGLEVWQKVTVNGITMGEAILSWWSDSTTAKALRHTYSPCQWFNTEGSPVCLDTCPSGNYSTLQQATVSVKLTFTSAVSDSTVGIATAICLSTLQTYFAGAAANWEVTLNSLARRSSPTDSDYKMVSTSNLPDIASFETVVTAAGGSFPSILETNLAAAGIVVLASEYLVASGSFSYEISMMSSGEKAAIAIGAFGGILVLAATAGLIAKLGK